MTRDDVIRMAREAGPLISTPFDVWCERFATLVAAAEREACAKVCEARYMGDNNREDQEAKRCAEAIRNRSAA